MPATLALGRIVVNFNNDRKCLQMTTKSIYRVSRLRFFECCVIYKYFVLFFCLQTCTCICHLICGFCCNWMFILLMVFSKWDPDLYENISDDDSDTKTPFWLFKNIVMCSTFLLIFNLGLNHNILRMLLLCWQRGSRNGLLYRYFLTPNFIYRFVMIVAKLHPVCMIL